MRQSYLDGVSELEEGEAVEDTNDDGDKELAVDVGWI